MASKEKEVWPPPAESRATRQKRIQDTLPFASSSKRKSIPKQQLQELLHRLQLDLKTEGNQLFEETKYIEARSCYDDVVNIQNLLISEELEVNSLVAVNVRCNRAECLLRIGDEDSVKQALGDCNVVLGITPRDERAMFRKAKALKKLGKLPEAHQTVIDLGQFCKKAQVSELRIQIEREIQEQQHQHSRNSAGLMNQWYLNGGLGAQQRAFNGHVRPHIPYGQPTFSYPRFPLLGPTAMPYFQPRVEDIRNHVPGTRTTSYPHVGLQSPFYGHATAGIRQDGILGSPPPYSHYSSVNESRNGETITTESPESTKNDREVDESWLPETVKQIMKKKSDKNKKTAGMKGSRSRSASSSRQGISNNKQQARRNSEEKIGTKQKSRQDAKRDSSAIHVNSDLSTNPVPNNEVNNFRQHRKDQSQTVQCEARPSKQSTPEVSDKVQESQWITVTSKKGTAKNTMGQTPITTVVTERLNIKPTPDCLSIQSYNQGGGGTSSEQTTPLQPQSHSQEQPTVEASETEEDSGWTLVTSKKSSTKKIPNSQSAMPSMKLRPTSQGNQSTPKKTGSPQSSYTFQQTRSVSSKTPLLRTAVSDMANPPSADSLPMAFRQLLETNEFALACKQCFTQTPGQFGQGSYSFNQALDHTCWGDILLSCAKGARVFRWKKIRPRLNKKYTGKYWLCSEFENEEKCAVREDRCHYAHSQEEIDFWTKERQYKLKRSELETYLKHLPSYRTLNSNIDANVEPHAGDETLRSKAASTPWLGNAPVLNTITAPPLQKPIPMSSDTGGRLPGNKPASTPTIHTPIVQPKKTKYKMEETRLPFQMKVVCKTCWESPLPNTVEATNGRETCVVCANKLLKEILIRSKQGRWIAVNSIPKVVINKNPSALRMCVHAKRGKDHYKIMTGRDCANPHSLEEMALWTWQWQNKVLSFEDLTTILQQNERARKQRFENSKSKTWQIRDDDFVPIDLTHGRPKSYNCAYCNKQCNSHFQLQQHFTSSSHKYRVMTDKDREHEWKHRPPPWNVHEDYLKLCARELKQSKSCPYGECTYAHSKEELHEWKERAAYRRMKIKRAKEQDVYSFVDALVEKYNDEQAHNVFSEDIEDVNIECKSELSTSLMKTEIRQKTTHDWKFKLSSDTVQLLQVGLLFDVHRQYFYLKDGKEKLQIASGSKFASEEGDYEVCVGFESQVFGSFHQGVVFSFGSEPVLLKQLTAHVGSSVALEEVHDMHHQTDVTAWNFMNSDIVKYDDPDSNDFDNGLLKKYKDPSSFKEQSVQLTKFELTRKNYGHQMHRLLNVEELSQMKMIERFSCKTFITASRSITQETKFGTTTRYAQGGQLFSKIQVGQELSDDYEAGRILLRSVNAVLIKPCNTESRVVYEAIVVSDQDFSGIDKQSVFIQLSEQSCKAMGLKHNQKIEVEIQFRINRLPFCRQHYAIDAIISHQLNVIFPQFHPKPEVTQRKLKKIKGLDMNRHQLLAARLVIERTPGISNPLIIYGPFGTGKTFTIAMSIQQLVKERPDARILVCTMSNSAADLYITQYLDKMISDGYTLVRLLRIYARHRRVQTIPPVVAKYCQLQEVTGGYQEVRMPTTDDVNQIKDYSVVVTTLSNSMILKRIGLEGHFTHIFIDEAGQALETEAIIPLTLAGENTKIILAGDHRQMSPEVYSEYARENKFHHSLLKRLYGIYLGEGKWGETCRVMLDENYRCHENILAFISRLFYGKELIASSNPPQKRHPEIYPLVFYSAYGEEMLVGTSYHNVAEAQELVERVKWLCQNWPKEWGPAELNRIGVVSPYPAQVQQVRKSLRTLGLQEVTVESINNIQGKEYRALFISTVRTRKVTQTDEVDVKSLNLGFLSDRKLLNTAFTRAQSLVAVVGDPVALCSIGKCSNYWRKFISGVRRTRAYILTQ
ncbi:3'-5' exoribonuclease HELZ2-like [Ptychodera flava]|uniref:3'-5' exoribonuclease HELZ2-like n=1 Tax=Ptychodera flava TaxID=63121 RepID=UPI00396A79C2